MIIKNLCTITLIFMNIILLLIVLYFSRGTKDKSSKIGFGAMIFVYVLNVIALIGGVIV